MTDQPQCEELDLTPFYGKFVAWNLTRTQILASADDEEEVWRLVKAAQMPMEQVIFSYVPRPDEVFMSRTFHENAERGFRI